MTRQPLYQEVAVLVEVGSAPCCIWEEEGVGSGRRKPRETEREKARENSSAILVHLLMS